VITERVDHFVMKHGGLGALPAVGIFTLRDGKIILWREYFDRVTLETQMAPTVE
jgi:limonene-1,2-epoxide hydrolase